jgi:hypothetical protein
MLPAPAENNGTNAFSKNPFGFVCAAHVDQNDASLERLDGVRILANGWRASERLQPKINRRYF